MPRGYPKSVAPAYAAFSGWHFAHVVSGSATGVLSTQALLYSIGLGAGAIGTAAAVNWVLKDGLGQLGGVLYAGTFGSRFDTDPKRQRNLAGLLLQGATLVELLTPLVPALFLPLASVSNVAKNISWLATSASRAQLHLQLALEHQNLGDLTARAGAQSTAAGLMGTALGAALSTVVGSDISSLLLAYMPLAAISLGALHLSNRSVILTSLDRPRAHAVLIKWMNQGHDSAAIVSPQAMAQTERLWRPAPAGKVLVDGPVRLADAEFRRTFEQEDFVRPERYFLSANPVSVKVWVDETAGNDDELRAYLHASLVERAIAQGIEPAEATRTSHAQVIAEFSSLQKGLANAGWNVDLVNIFSPEASVRVLYDNDDRAM